MPSLEQVSKGSPEMIADGADADAGAFWERRGIGGGVPQYLCGLREGKEKMVWITRN